MSVKCVLADQTSGENKIYYGICETEADVKNKEVTIDGFEYQEGMIFYLCFNKGNTVTSPTLNINNSGAKNLTWQGNAYVTSILNAKENKFYEIICHEDKYQFVSSILSDYTNRVTDRRLGVNLTDGAYGVVYNGTKDVTNIGVTGILPVSNGGTGVSDLKSLYLALQEFEPVWSGWGRQDEVGDATWWANLKTWLSTSTSAQRQKCIGLTKKVSLSSPVLGANAATMVCVGADQDKSSYSTCYSLTFQTLGVLPQNTTFGSSALWKESTVYSLCNNFADYCSAKDSITTYVYKLTSSACNNSRTNSADIITSSKVWLPSEQEMGLNLYSPSRGEKSQYGPENYGYSYYTNKSRRIKYKMDAEGNLTESTSAYWERSRCYNYTGFACFVGSDGGPDVGNYTYSTGCAPAFVIAYNTGAIVS